MMIRSALEADLSLLVQMNKRLIEDERSRNPMSVDELRERMAGWLRGDWRIDLFTQDDVVVGYAVYQFRPDDYVPSSATISTERAAEGNEFFVPEGDGSPATISGLYPEGHLI